MDLAYKRIWPGGPTEAEQDEQLRAAGFRDLDPASCREVYRDGPVKRRQAPEDDQLPGLTNAIRALHPGHGDTIWIAFPEVLAHTDREAMARLADITRNGGVLGVASLNRKFKWHPDVADALDFLAVRGGYAERQKTEPARAAAAAARAKEDHIFQRDLRKATPLWKDLSVPVTEIAKAVKRNRATLYGWQEKGLLPPVRGKRR